MAHWRSTATLFTVAMALAGIVSLAACGGGDDLGDIKGTATAAAAARPSPTATPDPVAAYRAKVTAGIAKLSTLADNMNNDMLAASETQSDPKWPTILSADADQLAPAATTLKGLAPPNESYRTFATKLDAAAETLAKAAGTLKDAVRLGDAAVGLQAFELLVQGKSLLDEAQKALPAP